MTFSEYLFRAHTEQVVRRWAESLRYFRFCRAYGGHNNDGDRFLLALGYRSEADLVFIAETLGLTFEEGLASKKARLPSEQATQLREQLDVGGCPNLKQIGWCRIEGVRCCVYAAPGLFAGLGVLKISVSGACGNDYEVTESDFENARRIEGRLSAIAGRIIDPPQHDENCVCPKFYPQFFC